MALQDNLQIDSKIMQPKMTSGIELGLNLSALERAPIATSIVEYNGVLGTNSPILAAAGFNPNDPLTYTHANLTQIYDDLGVNHTLQTYFVKTGVIHEVIGANAADFYTWDVHYFLDKVTQKSGGTLSFYDVTGELSPSHSSFNLVTPVVFQTSELGSGSGTLSITPDFSEILQKWGTTSNTESVLATSPSADPNSIDATDTRNYQYSTGLSIYDSLGISHTLNLYFRKTADKHMERLQANP